MKPRWAARFSAFDHEQPDVRILLRIQQFADGSRRLVTFYLTYHNQPIS